MGNKCPICSGENIDYNVHYGDGNGVFEASRYKCLTCGFLSTYDYGASEMSVPWDDEGSVGWSFRTPSAEVKAIQEESTARWQKQWKERATASDVTQKGDDNA